MIVARRFIAGSVITPICVPGTPEYRPLIAKAEGSAFAKLNRFSHRNFRSSLRDEIKF
jgi:hypothetical protein